MKGIIQRIKIEMDTLQRNVPESKRTTLYYCVVQLLKLICPVLPSRTGSSVHLSVHILKDHVNRKMSGKVTILKKMSCKN